LEVEYLISEKKKPISPQERKGRILAQKKIEKACTLPTGDLSLHPQLQNTHTHWRCSSIG
jgi:hypothetical protein